MFRTRAGDFRISSDVKIDDITKINVAHNDPSGTVEIEYDDGFTVDIASGSGSQRYWPGDWTDGVVFRFSTFTAYMTELEIQGMLSLRVDQLPPQLTKFSHDGGVFNVLDPLGSGQYVKFEGLTMGGKSLPTGLVDLHIENVRSPADVDRIIEALETNAQNNGSLFLAEQRLSKTAELLETRGWTVELEPQYAHKIERSKAPHTSVIDGKAVHHVDRRRGGDRRKQFEGRCVEFNGTSEYATGPVASGVQAVSFWFQSSTTPTTNGRGLFGQWQGSGNQRSWLVVMETDGDIKAYKSADGTNASSSNVDMPYADGEWHHCYVDFAGTVPVVWIDGSQSPATNSGSQAGSVFTSSQAAEIGRYNASNSLCWAGKIYDPQVFDTALPESEIKALAEAGPQSLKPTLSSVPLIWLPMDDATSSPIIRNYGSLGSAGDFAITGTPSAVWSTQDRFSYPNAFGASAALVTNGVDSYVDTGVTLNAATAFTVLRRFRTLSNDGYDLDGFHNTGGNSIRLGRNGADDDLSFNYGSGSNFQEPNVDIEVGQYLTQAMVATANGTYSVRHDGVEVASATATGFTAAISNTHNYTIGVANENGTPGNWGHIEFSDYLIASRVLTDDEITWWRTRGASGTSFDPATDPDIHVDYRFDQPHPRIVHNYADPGNPGKIVGDCEWVAINHDAANPTLDMNGKALTWKGQVPRDAVISSPAVELNGTSESITLPIDLSSPSSWSFACRVKTTDSLGSIMDARDANDDGFRILWNAGNLAVSSDATDLLFASDDFDDGEWHYLEVDWDGATATAKLDGVIIGSGALSAPSSVTRTNVICGRYFDSSGGWLDGQIADIAMTVDGSVVGKWPCSEPSGTICYDVSGNNNHGTGAPTARTGSQNLSDHLITNGYAKATFFDGANDWHTASGPIGNGATKLSVGAVLAGVDLSVDAEIASCAVFTTTGRIWRWRVKSTGAFLFIVSTDGTSGNSINYESDPGIVTEGSIAQYDVTWDGATGTCKFYKNGTLVDTVVDAAGSSLHDTTTAFVLGNNAANNAEYSGTMLRFRLEPGQAWSQSTVTAIQAAVTAADFASISNGIYCSPEADGKLYLAGELDQTMTTNGAPEERVIPAGAGVPITYGPGIAAPGQDRLIAAEPNSPFALRYAGDYSLGTGDLVYEAVFGSGTSHVDLGATLIGATDDFDISLDFMRTSLGANASATLFGQYTAAVAGRFHIFVNADNEVGVFIDGTTDVLMYSGDGTVQLNRWYTIRLTRVGDVFTLYLDGVPVATQTQSGISVQQITSRLCEDDGALDEFNGRMRNLRVDNNGTVTERLTRGIALPGATLTNVTVSSKEYGAIGGRILFQKPDGTANLYETSMSAEMADIIASRKYY